MDKIREYYEKQDYLPIIELADEMLSRPLTDIYIADATQYKSYVYYHYGDVQKFVDNRIKSVQHLGEEHWETKLRMWGDILFAMHYLPKYTDKELSDAHKYAAKIVEHVQPIYDEARKRSHRLRHYKRPKIKIGYLSPDFLSHVNMNFVIQLLAAYHHSQFEVHAFSLRSRKFDDLVTNQIKECLDYWHDLEKLGSKEAAEYIAAQEVDILVDVSVHAAGSRTLQICAYKPASIIVSGIGYMSTSGIPQVDYFLTDIHLDPVGEGDEHFSEKLLRLPKSHFCYTPNERAQNYEVITTVNSPIVFGSLNSFYKLNEELLTVWQRIMARVPGSRLILQSTTSDLIEEFTREKLQRLGFNLDNITFKKQSGEYYQTYQEIDIMLDSYPYTGGGTTCDALYMGVPVITRRGTRHGTRFGASLLENLGLGELVVDNYTDYEDLAVELATSPEVVAGLKQRIQPMMINSPLMDAKGYINDVEALYKEIRQKFLHGEK